MIPRWSDWGPVLIELGPEVVREDKSKVRPMSEFSVPLLLASMKALIIKWLGKFCWVYVLGGETLRLSADNAFQPRSHYQIHYNFVYLLRES